MAFENVHDLQHNVSIAKEYHMILVGSAANLRTQFRSCPAELPTKRCQRLALRNQLASKSLTDLGGAADLTDIAGYRCDVVERLICKRQLVQD